MEELLSGSWSMDLERWINFIPLAKQLGHTYRLQCFPPQESIAVSSHPFILVAINSSIFFKKNSMQKEIIILPQIILRLCLEPMKKKKNKRGGKWEGKIIIHHT